MALNLGAGFFAPTPGVGFAADQDEKEYKPTANVNMTWVKGNHTFKWGGEMVVEGFPTQSSSRANALYGFSYEETQNPWEYTSPANRPQLGLYAPETLMPASCWDRWTTSTLPRLPTPGWANIRSGFFAQDNWKVTRKLTLELGLRWDYSTLLEEEHGRMQSANFQMPNPNLVPADSTTPLDGTGGLSEAVQSELSVRVWTAPRSGLPDRFQDGVPRGRGHRLRDLRRQRRLVGYRCRLLCHCSPGGNRPGHRRHPAPGAIYFRNGNPFAPGNIYGNGPLTAPLSGAALSLTDFQFGLRRAPCFRDSVQTDRFAVHYDRQGHGTAAAHFPMEHRAAARNHPQPAD